MLKETEAETNIRFVVLIFIIGGNAIKGGPLAPSGYVYDEVDS